MNKIAIAVTELMESKLKAYNENTIDVWVKYLSCYPENKVLQAIETLIISKNNFICIGDVIDYISPENCFDVNAIKAWEGILYCARNDIKFNDDQKKIINQFTTCRKLRESNITELNYIKNDFMKIYKNSVKELQIGVENE